MIILTTSFLACVVGVISAGVRDSDWLADNVPADSVLNEYIVQTGMNVALMALGVGSLVLCLVHWKVSIRPLYYGDSESNNGGGEEKQEDAKENGEEEEQEAAL